MNKPMDQEQLTAYVLGELTPDEVVAVEQALADDPDAQRQVTELRQAVAWTQEVYHAEAAMELTAEQREAIEAKVADTGNVVPISLWRRVRRPLGVVAAVAAVAVVMISLNVLPKQSMKLASDRHEQEAIREHSRANQLMSTAPATPVTSTVPAEAVKGVDKLNYVPQVGQQHMIESEALRKAEPESASPVAEQKTRLTTKADFSGTPKDQAASGTVGAAPASAPASAPAAPAELSAKAAGSDVEFYQSYVPGPQAAAPTPAPAPATPANAPSACPVVEQKTRLDVKADFSNQIGALSKEKSNALYSQLSPPGATGGSPYNDPRQNYWPGHNTESYKPVQENPFKTVASEPLSTFSIDVDTASYSNMRRFLMQGTMPPPDSVRIEELLNYFDYAYAPPANKSTPFAAHITVASCPWAPEHRLARVGIKGWEMPKSERPASNLVFLIDTSGSMQPENKLPLIKQALRLLVDALDERDRIAIVAYASSSGLVLPSTPGNEKATILSSIDRLGAGGSTQGSAGIQQAYDVATQNFLPGGTNRVILSTDGDFNVGVTNEGDLQRIIEDKAKSGVFLTVLGFGMGNLKDSTMQTLADKGNGNYAYIDSFNEAKKVLVDQLSGTLVTIAKDVKIQIEFNPTKVAGYRLLGYEKRMLAKEDFNDDKKDAGEIGAGHRVTALYEIIPAGMVVNAAPVDTLKYQTPQGAPQATPQSQFAPPTPPRPGNEELFTLKIRYKQPTGDTSTKLEFPTVDQGMQYAQADPDFKFAASVAGFGMLLRRSQYAGNLNWSAVYEMAQEGRGPDTSGYRAEFLNMVQQAQRLVGNYPPPQPQPIPMPVQPQPMPVDQLRYAPQE